MENNMPVSVHISTDQFLNFLNKIEVPESLVALAEFLKFEFTIQHISVSFGGHVEFIPLKLDALKNALAGKMGVLSLDILKSQIVKKLELFKNEVEESISDLELNKEDLVPILDKISKQLINEIGPVDSVVKQIKAMDLFKNVMPLGHKVKLYDAVDLLQPVHGTDESSTYYAIAFAEGLGIAARVKEGTVSFRLEGPSLSNSHIIKKLTNLSLKPSPKGHFSIHFQVDSGRDDIIRTMGALLFSLQLPYTKIQHNLDVFPGMPQ